MKTVNELIQKMKQHRILYLTMDSVRHYVVIDIFKIMMNIQLDIIIDFILSTGCQFMSLLLEKNSVFLSQERMPGIWNK